MVNKQDIMVNKRCATLSKEAFSLVEVVLAMGVATCFLLGIVGLLPVGLNTFQKAMEKTVEGQLVQKLSGEMILTPFTQIPASYANRTFLYDMEGRPVTSTADARYQVRTSLTNSVYPGWTNAVSLESNDPAIAIAKSIQVVQMDIVKMPGAMETNRFNIQIPNSGN